jgi:hypothetical protein
MNTIKLETNSQKLASIFENEVARINIWTTSYSTKKDFMEHMLTLSMYVLSWTECSIEWDVITTWKLEYKKRIIREYNYLINN